MSFEKSLTAIRNKFPTWMIRYGFEFKGKFYFMASPGKNRFNPKDTAVATFVVDPKTGDIETKSVIEVYSGLGMLERKQYRKASENPTLIDISKQQYQELLKL